MPRTRPHLSITLPRNFTFGPDSTSVPKTPDGRDGLLPPEPPAMTNPYRLRRRPRPANTSTVGRDSSMSLLFQQSSSLSATSDVTEDETTTTVKDHRGFDRARYSLETMPISPHTPVPYHAANAYVIDAQRDTEPSSRPQSACSMSSDSSNNSSVSVSSFPAGDGSCTSPESDAPVRRFRIKNRHFLPTLGIGEPNSQNPNVQHCRLDQLVWTEDMDRHLWNTYLRYLQDPTMTPFKMLPGIAPPLGVCHRVAREAKRTWGVSNHRRATHQTPQKSESTPSAGLTHNLSFDQVLDVDRTRTTEMGCTPIIPVISKSHWPKSGSSTRRRLRHLCKNRPIVAPHYQRLLQSRTPSPFNSSQSSGRSSRLQVSETSTPVSHSSTAFLTRDVHFSLATSTADTMQRDGPLAQLAVQAYSTHNQDCDDFNQTPLAVASDISIPSDLETTTSPVSSPTILAPFPRLGSPFGHHTWGPSHTRKHTRPKVHRNFASDLATIRNCHKMQFDSNTPLQASSLRKRPAAHDLEDLARHSMDKTRDDVFNHSQSLGAFAHKSGRRQTLDHHCNDFQHPLQSLFAVPSYAKDSSEPIHVRSGTIAHQAGDSRIPRFPATASSLHSPFEATAPCQKRRPLGLFSSPGPPEAPTIPTDVSIDDNSKDRLHQV